MSRASVKKAMPERLEALAEAFHGARRVHVITHDNPDPDALASAFALVRLIREFTRAKAVIAFGGIVGRAENRAMIDVLKLPVQPAETLKIRPTDAIALVDTQPATGNNSCPKRARVAVVLDHHRRRSETRRARFADVRPTYGATASILTEYLRAAEIRITGVLATALFYGIQSETQDLGREAAPPDVEASLFLYPRVQKHLLSRIRHAHLPRGYFRALHQALGRARIRGRAVVITMGDLTYPDLVAELADLFLRLDKIDWSICVGRFEDDILLSIRSADPEAQASEIIRSAVGRRGFAGGHDMIAGGRVPVGDLTEEDARLLTEELVVRVLKAVGQEDAPGFDLLE
jgi:nanoRNase/pAp phosphatase (c-di-AMP/oligoRNAs hydrolase)